MTRDDLGVRRSGYEEYIYHFGRVEKRAIAVMSDVMAANCNHLTGAVCLCETVAQEDEPRLLCASSVESVFVLEARFGVPVVGVWTE